MLLMMTPLQYLVSLHPVLVVATGLCLTKFTGNLTLSHGASQDQMFSNHQGITKLIFFIRAK